VEEVPATSQKESAPKFCRGKVVPLNLKKNPLLNSVEAVPATSQKESTPKFCGGGSHKSKKESPQNSVEVHSYGRISKRIRPQILWRQFPQISKRIRPKITMGPVIIEKKF
jgi:hypothetical protein